MLIYLWKTISHIFVCLPVLELTTFEQTVCPTKVGYTNALSLGTNICKKKRNVATLNSTHQAKKSVTLVVVDWNNSSAIYIASSESCEPNRFVRCWNKVEKKEMYSRTTTKSVPLLHLEPGFCQQNEPECD